MGGISPLELAIVSSWGRDTSNDPDNWSAENPALGQCVPTSAVYSDYHKGKLMRIEATLPDDRIVSHYVFQADTGEIIDLTKSQFTKGTKFSEPRDRTKDYATTREYVLSNSETRARYETLRQRVKARLK